MFLPLFSQGTFLCHAFFLYLNLKTRMPFEQTIRAMPGFPLEMKKGSPL